MDGATTRDRLLAAVRGDPGIHVSRLAVLVGLGHTACRRHVRALERSGVLRTRPEGRRVACWPAATAPEQRGRLGPLRAPLARRVAAAVLRGPGRRLAELSAEVGASPGRLRRHLGRLEAAGLVHRLEDRGGARFFAAAPLAPAVAARDAGRIDLADAAQACAMTQPQAQARTRAQAQAPTEARAEGCA